MYQRSALSLETAKKGIEAMLNEAAKDPNHRFAMAIVDDRGELVYFAREDGCSQFHNEMAIKKACTTVMGLAWRTREEKRNAGWIREGIDHTMFAVDLPFTIVAGGVPILKEQVREVHAVPLCPGGIGVSGASQDEDERIALVGLKAIQDALWPPKGGI